MKKQRLPASATDLTAWFTAEVLPHEHGLRRYLRGRFSCVRDVDDVIQDAYIRIMRVHAGCPVHHARQLLYTIASRLALDAIRRQRFCPFVEVSYEHILTVSDETLPVPERVALWQEKQILGEALRALTERRRTALELTRFDGLSGREAGSHMGVSESTVSNHVSAAVLHCRLYFQERSAPFERQVQGRC